MKNYFVHRKASKDERFMQTAFGIGTLLALLIGVVYAARFTFYESVAPLTMLGVSVAGFACYTAYMFTLLVTRHRVTEERLDKLERIA